MFADIG